MQADSPTNIVVPKGHCPHNSVTLLADNCDACWAERRIIAWLRNGCGREWTVVHPKDVADAIERGEHR